MFSSDLKSAYFVMLVAYSDAVFMWSSDPLEMSQYMRLAVARDFVGMPNILSFPFSVGISGNPLSGSLHPPIHTHAKF